MPIERTLALIKPDAYEAKTIGKIITMIEESGFKIVHIQLLKMTEKAAKIFYYMHDGKDFFNELIAFTSKDKICALVLEKKNAIKDFRKLIGATVPQNAESNTIRALYGKGIPNNAVHGSDSPISAKREITYIFGEFAAIPSSEKDLGKEY